MFIGTVDFGMYINAQMKLENASRAAAEYVYLHGGSSLDEDIAAFMEFYNQGETALPSNAEIFAEYVCECSDGLPIDCSTGCGSADYTRRYVEIDVESAHQTFFPYPSIPDSLNLSGRVRYQVQ